MQESGEIRKIDVVEASVYPNQSEQYRTQFRDWRRKPQNHYAFSFIKDLKESSFSEDMSILKETPASVEHTALRRLGFLIGSALVLYLVLENVLDKLIVFIMNHMNLDIEVMFLGSYLYGDGKYVFYVSAAVNLLKYLVPALVIGIALRLPRRVSHPMKLQRPKELLLGICITMLFSVLLGLFCVSRSTELEKYRMLSSAADAGNFQLLLHLIMSLLIIPFAAELLLHGSMFQVLRQFGDYFAIYVVSLIAALLAHAPQDALRIGIMTLIFSIFVVSSGSFWTAVLLHIIHEIYMFALYYWESTDGLYSVHWWLLILLPCLICLITGAYLLHQRYRSGKNVNNNVTYLKWYDKAAAFFLSLPMLSLIIVSLMLIVISCVML
ncbi:MAG: CPBP family intramembrane metalloprotease [Oscillospiraceae bacterium]|nr:CPBP family intramembrane metalloprotease [Oscillospiraceae bacterium]